MDTPSAISIVEQHNDFDEKQICNILYHELVTNDDTINSIITTWRNVYEDYLERYYKIVDEMCETYKDLLNTSEYISYLKVPFCWEYARVRFANEIYELLEEFQCIDRQISTFLNEMDLHRNISIKKADIKLSNSFIEYLDNVLDLYAHKSSCIKDDLVHLKKQGQEAFINSQQMSSTCGNETL